MNTVNKFQCQKRKRRNSRSETELSHVACTSYWTKQISINFQLTYPPSHLQSPSTLKQCIDS